jgi:hypothetical protein
VAASAPCPRSRHSTISLPTSITSSLAALGTVLAVTLGAGPAVAAELPPGGTFIDDDGNTHEGYIEALATEGITHGCSDDRYCPSDDITRGQMAAFLRRALGLPGSTTDHFTDDDDSLFEADINALADAGITKGCGGTDFCPDAAVTRGQMAAFLRRADSLPGTDVDHFTDDDGSRFEADINALAAAGITKGCGGTDFCPGSRTTRAQMASFIGRTVGLVPTVPPERDPADLSVEDAIRAWFPDVTSQAMTIADCESNFDPTAVGGTGGAYHGLFQIGEYYHRDAFERVTGQSWNDAIYVAYYNAEYARDLYERAGGWGPWSCRSHL